jgi:hypothetical protein
LAYSDSQVGLVKGLLYVVAQCLGGLTGAGLLKVLVAGTEDLRGRDGLGTTSVNPAITYAQVEPRCRHVTHALPGLRY